MKAYVKNSILALIAVVNYQLPAQASSKTINPSELQNLDLVCNQPTPQGPHSFIVYNIIVEPETISSIPEDPHHGPQYTGEYLAVVRTFNIEDDEDQVLYSGRKEFAVKNLDGTNFKFRSKKLNLNLDCSINGTADGGGAFSGSN